MKRLCPTHTRELVMARYKINMYFGAGSSSGNTYVYCEEDELDLLKNNENFRKSLVEKYCPQYAGKVYMATVSRIEKV